MKHMRKTFSLIMALVMIVCLAVPAFAASTDEATVTVYVTTGMFTKGGIDENGKIIAQEFKGGSPENALASGYEAYPVDGATISDGLAHYRAAYSAPSTLSEDVNVLDAIVCSLEFCGFSCSGGWSDYTGPNGDWATGGYIHTVSGFNESVSVTENALEIDGVSYDRYNGSGWQIVVKYPGGSYAPLANYATNYPIVDGMEIIFDYSPYVIYDVHYEG